jgi:hypothetical protein
MMTAQVIDEVRLEALLGHAVADMGAALNGVLVLLGGELGLWRALAAADKDRSALAKRFRAGDGCGWPEHDPDQFIGTEQVFRPGYCAHLASEWIPALEGVEEKLLGGVMLVEPYANEHAGRQPEPRGQDLLRRIGGDLHAGSARPGGRARSRRAGRRDPAPRGRRGVGFTRLRRATEARSTSCSRRGPGRPRGTQTAEPPTGGTT